MKSALMCPRRLGTQGERACLVSGGNLGTPPPPEALQTWSARDGVHKGPILGQPLWGKTRVQTPGQDPKSVTHILASVALNIP